MNEFTLLRFSGNINDAKNNERLTQDKQLKELKAPDHIVQNVLNYSKALSIRKSSNMKEIKNIMN